MERYRSFYYKVIAIASTVIFSSLQEAIASANFPIDFIFELDSFSLSSY
jgi:hypothetical protein